MLVNERDGVALVTLNRPETGNAFDMPVPRALLGILQRVTADDNAHAVLLTGGGQTFCAGVTCARGRLSPIAVKNITVDRGCATAQVRWDSSGGTPRHAVEMTSRNRICSCVGH